MTERQAFAKFNSLLAAGLSLQQAERVSGVAELTSENAQHYRFFRELCLTAGASPVPAMARLQQLLESRAALQGQLGVAAAGPKATARLVYWLPVAALLLGQLAGLGSLEVFAKAPLSILSLVVGAIFLLLANLWMSKLLSRSSACDSADFSLDAFAIVLASGLPASLVSKIISSAHSKVYETEIANSAQKEIEHAKQLSTQTGAPISQLLFARSDELRQADFYSSREAVESLAIKLLWPLGLLVLPAFVSISVIPISIALLTKG